MKHPVFATKQVKGNIFYFSLHLCCNQLKQLPANIKTFAYNANEMKYFSIFHCISVELLFDVSFIHHDLRLSHHLVIVSRQLLSSTKSLLLETRLKYKILQVTCLVFILYSLTLSHASLLTMSVCQVD